jgi:hypothetical protein
MHPTSIFRLPRPGSTASRWFLATILAFVPCLTANAQSGSPTKRPNIVFIGARIGRGMKSWWAARLATLARRSAANRRFSTGCYRPGRHCPRRGDDSSIVKVRNSRRAVAILLLTTETVAAIPCVGRKSRSNELRSLRGPFFPVGGQDEFVLRSVRDQLI